MRHRTAAILYVAFALAVAIFTGSAFADPGKGNSSGNSDGAPGQVKKEQAPPAATPAPAAAPEAAAAQQKHAAKQQEHAAKQQEHAAEQRAHAAQPAHAAKPAKSHVAADGSKQYGHGKSALQIARANAPAKSISASDLSGPGNSEPHKITICHNGHLITVDVHALKAHASHLDGSDVIPATSEAQCAAAQQAHAAQTAAAQQLQSEGPCLTRTESVTVGGYVLHHTGSKTNPWVKIEYNAHSAHVAAKHADDVVVAPHTEQRTVVVSGTCASATVSSSSSTSTASSPASSEQSEQSSQSQTAGTSQTQSASGAQSAGGTAPAAVSAGGVKGATVTLKKPVSKPKGGVLGATTRLGKTVATSHLPFTGLPLWIFLAVAGALVASGYLVRRGAADRA